MKWVVPIAKAAKCPPDLEHFDRYEIIIDDYGLLKTICPEHGPLLRIESVEFDTEAEALEYVALRKVEA